MQTTRRPTITPQFTGSYENKEPRSPRTTCGLRRWYCSIRWFYSPATPTSMPFRSSRGCRPSTSLLNPSVSKSRHFYTPSKADLGNLWKIAEGLPEEWWNRDSVPEGMPKNGGQFSLGVAILSSGRLHVYSAVQIQVNY